MSNTYNSNILLLEILYIILYQNCDIRASMKDDRATGKAYMLFSKENIQNFKNCYFYNFFLCGSLLPTGIQIQIQLTKINADPDPQ